MNERATISDLERRLAAAEAALSEKADVELALRRSEGLRRIAVEGGRMGTWRWDLRDECVWGDPAFLELWGFPPSDEPRRLSDFTDRMSPQGRAEMGDMVTRAIAASEEFDGRLAVVGGPTSGHWVRWRGRAERDRPWLVNGVSFDVTEQQAKDERLRESETRHRLLIESWTQAVWETDAHGVVVADSPSWRAYTGQTLEEWLGYGWLDAIHPDDRAAAERQWREAVAARGLVDAEFRLRAADGGWRWTNVRAAPVLDAGGSIEKWVGVNIDIDDRRRAEATLRESESRLRTLFDSIDEGYAEFDVILDEDGQVVDWRYVALNAAFTRLTGMEDVTGLLISEILPDLEPEWRERYTRLLKTGEPIRFEQAAASLDQWYEVYAARSGGPESRRIVVVYNNITERKRAELVLREGEQRQTFLLKLSDTIRPLADPVVVEGAVTKLAMDFLEADRCYYCTIENGEAVVRRDACRGDLPSVSGRYPISSFPIFQKVVDDGRPLIVHDAATSQVLDDVLRPICLALHIISFVDVPVIKDGRAVGILCLVQSAPRVWTPTEVNVVVDLAERTWATVERARAEAALRESEARFIQFANASAAALWIRDADTLAMEFTSRAIETIYGIEPDAILGAERKWAALIVPDDRDVALNHIQQARKGEAVVHEFRIQRPSDGAFRWIRNTDFPLYDGHGRVQRIGGIAEDVTEAKLAAEHQGVLLAELQHRVRNIMAMIRSITARTGERADSVQGYGELMMGRLLALARVQALLTRAANVSVGIRSIVLDEVSVQAQHESQYLLDGPDITLSPKAAEVLTLAIHELATNALKYGALCVPHGKVTVSWATFEKRGTSWLGFDWTEEGAPERPQPIPGAPQRATVFGGALDMTGEADLTGHRILVVEDDYYLATDAARALQGAGAEVLGPFSTEEDARDELAEQRPDAALLDINLGLGPSFKLAEHLKDIRIPFVFTTGYDPEVIPAEFEGVERLQKPVQLRQIVGAVSTLLKPIA